MTDRDGMTTACQRDPWAEIEILRDQNERLKAAILDIDAHATGLGEDDGGFITGGYIIPIGCLHRALGIIGHTAAQCRTCRPESHDCTKDEIPHAVEHDPYLTDCPCESCGNRKPLWAKPRRKGSY